MTAWSRFVARLHLEEARTEVARQAIKLGKSANSVWSMNKSDLVRTAMNELGLSLANAESKTVIVLREMIRSARQVHQAVTNPLAAVPKGLEKMSREELLQEAHDRSLPADPGDKNVTRARLILMIRDSAESHRTVSTQNQSSTSAGSEMTGLESEWDHVEQPSTRTKRR